MAIITALSAKGSPGVTTTVVALTLAWASVQPGRSALAMDADPVGGDTGAGFLRGAVPPDTGILSLATARGVHPGEALDSASVRLRADGSARLIPGVPDEARAAALPLAWGVVAEQRATLHQGGCDVIVDAGRMGAAGPPPPWLADSDLVVLVVRPGLPSVAAAHRLVAAWSLSATPVRLLVIDSDSPYRPPEVAKAVGVPLVSVLPFDAEQARVHSDGSPPRRGFDRSGYVRGVLRAAADISRFALERADFHLLPAEGAAVREPDGRDTFRGSAVRQAL